MMIPHKIHPWTREPNKHLSAETAAMYEQLKKPNAALIYFNGQGRLWYLPSENELAADVPLQIVKAATDGRIYSVKHLAADAKR